MSARRVGLLLGTLVGPTQLREAAAVGERLGFDELWLAEDYFYTGAVSSATAVLSSTSSVSVGTGIMSAMVRHPAVLAMEISTIASMYPGRFVPGIALGVRDWLRQMDLDPRSPLTALRECVGTVRALLAGGELSSEGSVFRSRRVKLEYPAPEVPIYMGGFAPRMLELGGEIADGNIIGLLTSSKYLRWARERIEAGMTRAGKTGEHPVVVFVFFSAAPNGQQARNDVRSLMALYLSVGASEGLEAAYDVYGITEELRDMERRGGADLIEREMPPEWLEDLAIVGDPDECAEKLNRYFEAGADSVVLMPMPDGRAREVIEFAAAEVLPRL